MGTFTRKLGPPAANRTSTGIVASMEAPPKKRAHYAEPDLHSALKALYEQRYCIKYKDAAGDQHVAWAHTAHEIPRPNHALANAARKSALVPHIAAAYRDVYRHDDFGGKAGFRALFEPPAKIASLQLAIAFESAGREEEFSFQENREKYDEYRNESCRLLREYSTTTHEAATALESMWGVGKRTAAVRVLEVAHDLDLFRCKGHDAMESRMEKWRREIGEGKVNVLVKLALDLLLQTGDRIQFVPHGFAHLRQERKRPTFVRFSRDPDACIEMIKRVSGVPTKGESLAESSQATIVAGMMVHERPAQDPVRGTLLRTESSSAKNWVRLPNGSCAEASDGEVVEVLDSTQQVR